MTVLWVPSDQVVASANTTQFARAHGLAGREELLARSIAEPEWFWDAVVRHLGLPFDEPYTAVLDASAGPEWARWFVNGRLNLANACVHRHARGAHAEREAVRAEREDGRVATLTYAELSTAVARVADGLAALGVQAGDRVALILPMSPEVVIALYACAHLGAISVPIFSGFSAGAISARLNDSGASVAICADGTYRRGRPVAIKANVDAAAAEAPGLRHVVVHRHAGLDVPWQAGRDVEWADLLATGDPHRPYAVLDAEHPVMIAYTSGTTGRPKGSVHVHGGFLTKIAQEVWFEADLKDGDALHWATDMGWIMGPWSTVGVHASAGTAVVFDGVPDHPDEGRLWRFAADHRLAFLGVSPTLIRALQPRGAEAARAADLSALRAFGSTGEPWNPEPYRWLFEEIGGGTRPIINISGGTECAACLVACDVTMSLSPCSLGGPALGMDVDVFDVDGNSVRGAVGELVCKGPWPAMTRGVWGDDERYLATYWSRWPGIWVHGDWASVDADGEWYLHGRSDDVLNVAGKRIGPAEFESALVEHPAVQDACAIGVPHDLKGETAWCFVVLVPGQEPSEELRAELVAAVEGELGKAFSPGRVGFVRALPRTRSAKIVRRAVRAVVLETDPGDLSTLEDPTAIDAVREAR